jgi:eukaryotic-like serine/threonine-protein kinase
MTLPSGTRLGPYEILAPIGAGGMGEVYRAKDPRLGREVALKVLPGDLADDRDRLARFEREARAASALNHPNIITIYEIGHEGGVAYIAMELVDGLTLREMLVPAPFETTRVWEVGAQIAEGLAKAHAAGIVHRDLKPENVMVSKDGFVKILDFGLARRAPLTEEGSYAATITRETEPGKIFGTVGYMSPEQATGRLADDRSDQFSFGTILYEMATGRRAFGRASPVETLSAILKEQPVPASTVNPAVPDRLSAIISRCLAKDPEERYASTKDLARDLRELGGAVAAAPPPAVTSARRARTRRAVPVVVGVVIALLAATLILTRSRGHGVDSIAVLPFETPASEPEVEYLGQGISDNLIQSLSRLPDLRVIARSSVSRYKGQPVDPEKIGRELQVQAVLTGTVAQRGDQLEVTAELVDARRNAHVWGERYDRNFADIISLQQDISGAIAQQLRPKRAASEESAGGQSFTADPAAYRSYLKGRYHWNKRTEADVRKAIGYFQEAIDKDPSYAAAYDGLCDSWLSFGWYEFVPPRDAYPRARAAAQRALDIDAAEAEAHASLAALEMWYDWNWLASQREFARMLELNPNYAAGRHWHADLLSIHGRHDEAIAESKKALELDPLSLIINTWLGRRYYFARRFDEAARECRKALEFDLNFAPAHWQLGSALVAQGKLGQAVAEFETAVRLAGKNPRYLAYLGNARAKAGDAAGARAILEQLVSLEAGGRYVSALDRALVYSGLGENNRALDWIEKAFDDRPSLMPYLNIDPLWDGLLGDPRFTKLVARLGLAEAGSSVSPSR